MCRINFILNKKSQDNSEEEIGFKNNLTIFEKVIII